MEAGKVALVTGAGSGIGKAAAWQLSREGFAVAVVGRNRQEILATAEELSREGGHAHAIVADISIDEEMRLAVMHAVERFGRLDVVVANAGINGTWAPIEDLRPHEWDQTIETNLRGTYLTIHHAVPHLKAGGGGAIVVVSSINGTRTFTTPGATAYSATKAAQVAMVQQLSLELARHRIRINAVCPGEIDTNITDNTDLRDEDKTAIPVVWPEGQVPITGGRPGRSRDVAEVIAFLAGDKARHVTGTPVWVDGGQGLLR